MSLVAMAIVSTQLVSAQSFPNPYQKCDEGVHPFIPGAPATATGNDIAHPSESVCFSHLQGIFPNNQHIQPVDSVSHLPLKTTERSAPIALHEHHYINESNSNDGFYKRAWLRKFQIKLQPDFKEILKPGTLRCPTVKGDQGFANCPSFYENPTAFGGTRFTFDGTTMTYEFGINQTKTNTKPIIPGINPDIDQGVFFPGDTTQAIPGRWFSMAVDFETKDMSATKDMWSATTTSRAEVIHTAIPKSAFNAIPPSYLGLAACQSNPEACRGKYYSCNDGGVWDATNSWCNVGGYNWVNVATDVTVWETTETTEEAVCTGLDLTIAQGGNTYNSNNPAGIVPNQPMQLNVTPSFDPANESIPLKYRWSGNLVVQPEGEFRDDQNSPLNGNPFIDLNTATWYSGGAANTVVRVVALDENDQPVGCEASFPIPPEDEGGMCLSLTANYSKPVMPGDNVTINPTANFSSDLEGVKTITWSESGDGYFSNIPFQQTECLIASGDTPFTKPTYCKYIYTAVSPGDSFTLSANPNPTNNDACILNEIVTDDETPQCEYLDFLPPENGQICIDVDPNYTGDFTWTIDNQIIQTSDTCQPYDEDSSYEVEATDAPVICRDEFQPEEDECTYFNFTFPGDEICVDTDYEGDVEWIFNGGNPETYNENDCFEYNPAFSYEAAAVNTDNPQCKADIPPEESELIKEARRTESEGYSAQVLTLRPNDTTVYYRLRYVPLSNQKYTTTIVDTISDGFIDARLFPETTGREPGQIEYNEGSMEVLVNGQFIGDCQDIRDAAGEDEEPIIEDCYDGDIGNGGVTLRKVMGEALIRYEGTVDSSLTDEACREGSICQEKYINEAETENSVVHVDEENDEDIPEVNSNPITVQLFCQYILTRAAGDIFLENDLSTGIDINQCSRYRSSTGIIITPGEEDSPPLVSTGAGDTSIFSVGHEVCTAGQAGKVSNELAELYGSNITGLSSQICEVKLRTGSPWKQEVITNSIDENKTRASRWGADPALGNNLSTMLFTYPDEDVYHVKGNVSSGSIRMDEVGAKTFIIEDGDLHITDNIVYTGTCPAGPGRCSVRDVASLAFIVLNGSIYVDPGVTEISGVYFVQEGDTDGSGRLYSGSPGGAQQQSDEQLTIYGSVYGDIDPLFAQRFFSGDPESELGGIVVRFDQRVILNTPPALRDILNLSQTEVAR